MTGFSVSLIVSNFSNVASYLSPIFETIPSKVVPAQIEKVVSLVSRTGRDLQRYDNSGYRQVVGYVFFPRTIANLSSLYIKNDSKY